MTTTTPALSGLVEMTNEQYHAAPGISKSHLDKVSRSPRHYWALYVDPGREPEEPTAAMVLGSAVHAAVLEPAVFATRYVMAPDVDKRTNAGKAAWAAFCEATEAGGKVALTEKDHALCLRLAQEVRGHELAGGLLRDGRAEQSYFATDRETGALLKCRPDWLTDGGWVVDLKTTEDASPHGFGRSAALFRYDVQAAFYLEVLEQHFGQAPEGFIFVAVEKTRPYAIGVYYVTPEQIAAGRQKARRDLERLLSCQAAGLWPDYGKEPQVLKLPAWAALIEEA